MNRPALVTGGVLVVLGLGIFLWKVLGHDLPVAPSGGANLWRIEVTVDVRGNGQRGSVSIPLPRSDRRQSVLDTRVGADRLDYEVQEVEGLDPDDFYGRQRLGVFSGRLNGDHHLSLGFRADLANLAGDGGEIPLLPVGRAPADLLVSFGRAETELPVGAPEVRRFVEERRLPNSDDPAGRLRMLAGFVTDQVGTTPTGSDDPLLTFSTREGTVTGKVRLLTTLLRAAEVPARPVLGLMLEPDQSPTVMPYLEAWVGDRWYPISVTGSFFGRLPKNLLVLDRDSLDPITTTGVSAVGYRFDSLRERLRPEELDALMVPDNQVLRAVSLYQLPVASQKALRALLLLPIGVLIVAFFRNLVGVSTFGTFMPVLIGFALKTTTLGIGLALVIFVIGTGIIGRLLLDRLRLLMVPRLSVLLCIVVLVATGIAVAGGEMASFEFTTAVYFPIVILTMLVERFSVTLAEEGMREALVRSSWSVLIAVVVYPIFRSDHAEHLMFGFPELVFVAMGILVWIGAYTGYRASDLLRFRSLAQQTAGSPT